MAGPAKGTKAKRITPAERTKVKQLHAQGLGRNAIAAELGRPVGTVTNIATELGLSFDRASTKAATEARRADLAARRADLESQLLDDADRLRAQIWSPHEYIDHGGKEYVEVRWTQEQPSPVDKLKLMQAAGIAIDRSLKIATHDQGSNHEAARSMLGALFEQLRLAVDQDPDDG